MHYIPERFHALGGRSRDARVGHVIARHLLVERLRRPGIDSVYRALQLPALLAVELTFAPVAREPEVHDNLFRQALALALLGGHPNITRLVAFGAEPEGTYLAIESQAEARSLADVVTHEGNDLVSSAAARVLLEPLSAALGALARGQLVHGEIRPEHVLVHQVFGYSAFVQLGGFVRLPAAETVTAFPTHELVWRAPEQIFEHAINPTTDGYSVAAIAFALLFGRPPFAADDREALLDAKRDSERDPTDGLAAAVPPEVLHFFQAALAYEPSQRYVAAGFHNALLQALDALAEDEAAPAVSPGEPLTDAARSTLGSDEAPARARAPSLQRDWVEPTEPIEHRHPSSDAGATQRLSTRELEALASRRGTPRMHRSKR